MQVCWRLLSRHVIAFEHPVKQPIGHAELNAMKDGRHVSAALQLDASAAGTRSVLR